MSQNDPDLVRAEYADESRLAVRTALWVRRSGRDPVEVAVEDVRALSPRRLLEVGCGRGELAARIVRELGVDLVAVDLSPRMVELTRARGVDARVADVQALPFSDATFDCVVANFVLYHVPELERAFGEIARVLVPGGSLVAATNGYRQLAELWELVGRDLGDRRNVFMRENGAASLRRVFGEVRIRELDGTIELTADEMCDYVANSVAHRHLADRVPRFDGTRCVTTSSAVFVATKL